MSKHSCFFPTTFWTWAFWQCPQCGQLYRVIPVGRWDYEWRPTTRLRRWLAGLFG